MRRIIVVTTIAASLAGAAMLDGARLRARKGRRRTRPRSRSRPSSRTSPGEGFVQLGGRGGQFTITNAPLRLIIRNAYRLQDFQIVGGPGWLTSDRFDIVAKSDPTATPGSDAGDDQGAARGALQAEGAHRKPGASALRAPTGPERRQARAEDQDGGGRLRGAGGGATRRPATAGPGGPGARVDLVVLDLITRGGPGGPGGAAPPPPGGGPGGARGPDSPFGPCGMRIGPGNIAANGQPMSQLATTLSIWVNRTVVDRTGLTGSFDLELSWTPEQLPQGRGDPPPGAPPLPPIDPNGPSIFTAVQEQLGLKLDSQRGPGRGPGDRQRGAADGGLGSGNSTIHNSQFTIRNSESWPMTKTFVDNDETIRQYCGA